MPLFGSLDIKKRIEGAPLLDDLSTGPWELPGAQTLQLLFEIDDEPMLELLPPALHPTLPPTAWFLVIHAPESDAGPFTLAQVRIGCRASAFQRGFVMRAYCDSESAIAVLRERWGFDAHPADVRLTRRHDRVIGEVALEGETVLACELIDPLPIGMTDVRYVDGLNLARVQRDVEPQPRLVQVDPAYEIQSADRGEPHLLAFDAAAWRAEGLRPNHPISASFTVADVTLPRLRFLIDPTKPAYAGTERL